jgi:hypothetical protein
MDNIDALLKFLIHILNSKENCLDYIKHAAYLRLENLVREKRPAVFNEEELNLPLS